MAPDPLDRFRAIFPATADRLAMTSMQFVLGKCGLAFLGAKNVKFEVLKRRKDFVAALPKTDP